MSGVRSVWFPGLGAGGRWMGLPSNQAPCLPRVPINAAHPHLLLGPHTALLGAAPWHVSLPFSCSQSPGVSSVRVCRLHHSPGCSPCMFPRVGILVRQVLPCAEGDTSLSPGSCEF